MEKLEYLKKYSADISFVDFSLLPEEISSTLPEYWRDILSVADTELRHQLLFNEWSKYSYQYQSTLNYLRVNLLKVELIFNNSKYSLLYSVKNRSGNIVFYEGRNPYTKEVPAVIGLIWDSIPKSFTNVYDQLHNGWVYFSSQSNGILPIEDVFILGDLDWGILDDIDAASLPFNLGTCVGFFSNGLGDYASIDLSSRDKNTGFIWWHAKPPKLNVEIWPVIDEWTMIGIEK